MSTSQSQSRREFIRTTTAAMVGGTLASSMTVSGAWAAGSDEIRVGVVGCGGRGTGAIDNVLFPDPASPVTMMRRPSAIGPSPMAAVWLTIDHLTLPPGETR